MRFYVLLCFYFIASMILHLNGSYVPDEQWFESIVLKKVLPEFQTHGVIASFFSTNAYLGYGSFFWYLYGLIALATRKWVAVFIPLRVFLICGTAFAWGMFYTLAATEKRKKVTQFFLLFLTFPAAWWTGKVAGPDLMCSCLILIGSALLLPARRLSDYFGFFILGVAVGVKMTALPPAVVICLWSLWNDESRQTKVPNKERLGAAAVKAIWFPVGLICGNFAIFSNIVNSTGGSPITLHLEFERLRDMWIGNRFEWDGVLSGGLTAWSFSLVALASLLIFLAYSRSKLSFLAVTGVLALTTFCFLKAGPLYGWYWFPTVFAFPILLLNARWDFTNLCRFALPAVIALNLLTQLPQIYEQINSRWAQRTQSKNFLEARRCIENQFGRGAHFAEVIQLTEPQFDFLDVLNADEKSGGFAAFEKASLLSLELKSANHVAPLLLLWSRRLSTRNNGLIEKILATIESHPTLVLKGTATCDSFSVAEINFRATKRE